MTIEITSDYHTDLKAARAHGISFSRQPKSTALYEAITAYNESVTPIEFASQLESSEVVDGDTAREGTELYTTTSDELTLDLMTFNRDYRGNLLSEYAVPYDYGMVDTTIDDECADDEHLGTLSHQETLSQSPAIVMIVIIIAVLEVATRATSLGIALGVMAWNKLYNWYYKPVKSIDYFPDLSGDLLWN